MDARLPYTYLRPETTEDGAFLLKLLREATASQPSKKLVIAVDALDEVDLTSEKRGANILYLPDELPRNVYFILTRRRVDLPMSRLFPQHIFDLVEYHSENRRDIEARLHSAAKKPMIHQWITEQKHTPEEFVSKLADLSENNFMYLRHVLCEIEEGNYANRHIEELPKGLRGYYEDHWKIMGMTATPSPRVKIHIIYVMCELHQPASSKLIAEFANSDKLAVDELDVLQVLREWKQFLHKQHTPERPHYSIYHTSFLDFLKEPEIMKEASITLQGIHAQISKFLLRERYGNRELIW